MKKINERFVLACSTGQLDKVEEIVSHHAGNKALDINQGILEACVNANLPIMQYLNHEMMTSCKETSKAWNSNEIEVYREMLTICASQGHLEIMKYLFSLPFLQDNPYIRGMINPCWVTACEHGHLNMVQYLLTSLDVVQAHYELAYPSFHDHKGVVLACQKGFTHIISYIFTSPEIPVESKIDLDWDHGRFFHEAARHDKVDTLRELFSLIGTEAKDIARKNNYLNDCFVDCLRYHTMETLHYLIMEEKISLSSHVKDLVQKSYNEPLRPTIERMFRYRELNLRLDKELPGNSSDSPLKKPKI